MLSSDETLTSVSSPQGPSSKRSHTWSESWHDLTQSDRASDTNLTPSSANSESTNHDSLPMSAHDRTTDFAENSLDGAVENTVGDRPAARVGARLSSRSEFIRSSVERNRACQAILWKQMSDSLWRSRLSSSNNRCLSFFYSKERLECDSSEIPEGFSSLPEIHRLLDADSTWHDWSASDRMSWAVNWWQLLASDSAASWAVTPSVETVNCFSN